MWTVLSNKRSVFSIVSDNQKESGTVSSGGVNRYMTEANTYRNQSIDLHSKSMDWFLYDIGLRHEKVKHISKHDYQ